MEEILGNKKLLNNFENRCKNRRGILKNWAKDREKF